MDSYKDIIQFLYGLQRFGMKFGLEGIHRLLRSLGNPHLQFPSIHIAGTNGKGSTASMLAAIFTAAGYKTGLYTSPHLVDFRERIRINGVPISKRTCVEAVRRLKEEIRARRSTFFEATTALAFQCFAEANVEIAVVETGLGGRLDATNVLKPLATVITTIGLDHKEILGGTLEKISREKAGIIKRGTPCISGVGSPAAGRVIREACKRLGARLITHRSVSWRLKESGWDEVVVDMKTESFRLPDLRISLPGPIQAKNATLALLTVEELCSSSEFRVTEDEMRAALANIQGLTGLRGRFEVISKSPMMIADCSHNPQAMQTLSDSLLNAGFKHVDLVFGVMKDKDHHSMVRAIRPLVDRAILVKPQTERARNGDELLDAFRRNHLEAQFVGGVKAGVRRAMELAAKRRPIVITGSNFVVGEALAYLEGKSYLTINQ